MTDNNQDNLELKLKFRSEAELEAFRTHAQTIINAENTEPHMEPDTVGCTDSGPELFYTWSESQYFFPNRIRETVHNYWKRTIECPGYPPKVRTWKTQEVNWYQIDNPSTPPGG